MPSTNILFEVRPYKPGTGSVTLRMSSAYNGDDKGTQLDGLEWDNLIVSGPSYSFNYTSDQDGRLTEATTDLGGLQFRVGSFYDNEEWSTYEWNNAACRVWVGEIGQPFSAYRKLYEATCSGLERDGMTASVSLRALTNRLSKPLLNGTYAGTGNAEGPTTMKGNIKPIALGTCLSVEPVIVDAAKWIFQVHGYGAVQDIVQVYDFAQPVATLVATVNTYAELAALTLKPSEWAKCNALGMFRLGGASDKKITADVQGGLFDGQFYDSVADLIPALIRLAGFAPAKVGAFVSMANKGWSFYSTEEADIADVVQKAALDAGGYILTNNDGVWQGADAFALKAQKVLKADGSEGPTVGSVRELNVADPIYKVAVGHTPCWGVHSTTDISPKLLELAGSLAEQDELLTSVKATADLAKSKSEAAELEIDNMGKDGILDRGEKIDQLTALENAAAERREIASKITIYNATTEFNGYKAAHDALTSYLNPLLADLTVNTAIDRATFRSRWAAYRETHQAVWNAMAGDARTVSTWTGVSGTGKPQDNATVGATIGTNITLPGSSTPVTRDQIITNEGTSRNTLNVGSKTAADVVADLDFNADTMLEQIVRGDTFERLLAARTMLGSKPVNTAIEEYRKEFTDANKASAEKLSLLGAVSPDGQSLILNAESVKSGDGRLLATTLNTLEADSARYDASIENLQEVLLDPTGATARSVLKLDVNGYISGTVATNNGRESSFTVVTDQFKVVDPNGGAPATVFGYENGEVTIPSAAVGKLKVGAVDTESIGLFAIQKTYTIEASTNVTAPYNRGSKQMLSVAATKDTSDSDVEVEFFLRIRLGRYAGYFTIERSNASGTVVMDRIDYHAPELSNLNNYNSFRMPFSYKRRFSSIPAGTSTWRINLTHLSDNDSGDGGFLEAGTNLFVTEVKR